MEYCRVAQVGLLVVVATTSGLDNGMGLTPLMGWSTWSLFTEDFNETTIHEIADAAVSTGLADLGYRHINIDGGYLTKLRDGEGRLQINSVKFPSGMKALSRYLSDRGLLLGVYTDIGNVSCSDGPGSYGHYKTDAETFASWNASFLKVDFCDFWFMPTQLTLWREFRDALNATGHPIYYYAAPHMMPPDFGVSAPWSKHHPYAPPLEWNRTVRRELANSLMTEYVNLFDYWYEPLWGGPGSAPAGTLTNIDAMTRLSKPEYSGPGSWADAQQMEICNFGEGGCGGIGPGKCGKGQTFEEYRSQYSIWAVFASPMVLSADLRSLATKHPKCLAMIKNKELIEISQDPLGHAGVLIHEATNSTNKTTGARRTTNIVEQIWSRELAGGDRAVVLFNRAETTRRMSVPWAAVGISAPDKPHAIRDIWAHNSHGADLPWQPGGEFSATVASHAVVMIRVSGQPQTNFAMD